MREYTSIRTRDKICAGKKYKIKKIRTGNSASGLPYWAFDFYFYEKELGNINIYKRVTLMSREKCWAKDGDWVELEEILEYIVIRERNKSGGIIMLETLICKFKDANYKKGE